MPDPTAPAAPSRSRTLDVLLSLFDRQVLDGDGTPVGKVDDVELARRDDGRLVLSALLLGPDALTPRYDEPLGRWAHAVWARLRSPEAQVVGRVELRHLVRLDSAVHVAVTAAQVGNDGLERWALRHVVAKLPGSGHDPQEGP